MKDPTMKAALAKSAGYYAVKMMDKKGCVIFKKVLYSSFSLNVFNSAFFIKLECNTILLYSGEDGSQKALHQTLFQLSN